MTEGSLDIVGVVGTGRMGSAIARRSTERGHHVVVFNRTRAKAERLVRNSGVEMAESPAAVADQVDVVFTSLKDEPAVEQVYAGPRGLLSGLGPGSVAVETSTIGPALARRMNDAVRSSGAAFVDAPISARPNELERGAATLIVGARKPDLQRVASVLAVLGRVMHAGPPGAGATMKLAVNTVVFGYLEAIAEGLALAQAGGLSRERAYEILLESAVGSEFMRLRRPAFEDPGSTPVQVPLRSCAEIADLIVRTAADLGAHVPQVSRTARVIADAAAAGYAEEDVTSLAAYLTDVPRTDPTVEENHA